MESESLVKAFKDLSNEDTDLLTTILLFSTFNQAYEQNAFITSIVDTIKNSEYDFDTNINFLLNYNFDEQYINKIIFSRASIYYLFQTLKNNSLNNQYVFDDYNKDKDYEVARDSLAQVLSIDNAFINVFNESAKEFLQNKKTRTIIHNLVDPDPSTVDFSIYRNPNPVETKSNTDINFMGKIISNPKKKQEDEALIEEPTLTENIPDESVSDENTSDESIPDENTEFDFEADDKTNPCNWNLKELLEYKPDTDIQEIFDNNLDEEYQEYDESTDPSQSVLNMTVELFFSFFQKYISERKEKTIKLYDFFSYCKQQLNAYKLGQFIQLRRSYFRNHGETDPLVESIIYEFLGVDLPDDQLSCKLREEVSKYVDASFAVSDTGSYILEGFQNTINTTNTTVNSVINELIERLPEIWEDIKIIKPISWDKFMDISDKGEIPSDLSVTTEIDENDPNTWDIQTVFKKIGKDNIRKEIIERLKNNTLYLPSDDKQAFLLKVQTLICNIIKNNKSLLNQIKNVNTLKQTIKDAFKLLKDEDIIKCRDEAYKENGRQVDPKVKNIIDNIGSLIRTITKQGNSWQISNDSNLYKSLLIYCNKEVLPEINENFINRWKYNQFLLNIISPIAKPIDNIYCANFPNIAFEELKDDDIKKINFIFTEEKIKQLIEEGLKNPRQLFLPDNGSEKVKKDFSTILIQALIKRIKTANLRDNTFPDQFRMILNEYENCKADSNINQFFTKVRNDLFRFHGSNGYNFTNITDPLVIYVLKNLFNQVDTNNFTNKLSLVTSVFNTIYGYTSKRKTEEDKKENKKEKENTENEKLKQPLVPIKWVGLKDCIDEFTKPLFDYEHNSILTDAIINACGSIVGLPNESPKTTPKPVKEEEPKEEIVDASNWEYEKVAPYVLAESKNISSFLSDKALQAFVYTIIESIINYIKQKKIEINDASDLFNVIQARINEKYTYDYLIKYRMKYLRSKHYNDIVYDDPLINNIRNKYNLKISIDSPLFQSIQEHIQSDNLLLDVLQQIFTKQISSINNEQYKQAFPNMYKEKIPPKDISLEEDPLEEDPLKDNSLEDDSLKEDDSFPENNTDDDIDDEEEEIVEINNREKSFKEKSVKEKSLKEEPVKGESLKEESIKERPLKEEPTKKEQSVKKYIIDDYTVQQLVQLIQSYNPSFNIINEIAKAAIGHIESNIGESYKRIFKPLFEGEYKQKVDSKFAENLLKRVELNSLIVNDRNRFANMCRIFLFNISTATNKFYLADLFNQNNTFNKQIRHLLLNNSELITKINNRLQTAFKKYFDAYVNGKLDNNKYYQSFMDLSQANTINDSKGDIHQFKMNNLNLQKIIIINNEVYLIDSNKSFIDFLNEQNINNQPIINYAAGFITNDNCVFLYPIKNGTEEEIVSALKNNYQYPINKIYLTINKNNNIATERRLAKKCRC